MQSSAGSHTLSTNVGTSNPRGSKWTLTTTVEKCDYEIGKFVLSDVARSNLARMKDSRKKVGQKKHKNAHIQHQCFSRNFTSKCEYNLL